MADINEYKCPTCTAPLHYVGESGRLECDYCGQSFEVAEVEAFYATQENGPEVPVQEPEKPETDWDLSEMQNDWGEDGAGMKAYICPSCGAELICDETTAATSCPYCGNNTIIPGQFGGVLKPDSVIPFKLDKNAAIAALKQHYSRKFLLPRAFTAGNHLEEVKGVYVPFWLFDSGVDADCRFHGTRSHTHREGEYEVTVTEHYAIRRSGRMEFTNVPADGSSKMPDDYMDSIEPFDYSNMKPFSAAYLPGYLADKYDVDAEACMPRADDRCRNSALEILQRDVIGYETLTPVRSNTNLQRGKVHYALFPVWTLRTKWQDKDYVFMMNGQTGKLVGDLPVSKAKFWGLAAAVAAVLSALSIWSGIGLMIAQAFLG